MPYSPLIYTRLQPTALTTGVTLTVETDKPAHLLLTHSAQYPTRTPRFIRRYGYTRECGFYLRWTAYHTHDQTEPGDTTQHTYTLTAMDTPSTTWGAVAPSSHPIPLEPSTPPFPIPPHATGNPSIVLTRLANQTLGPSLSILLPFDTLQAANLWPSPPPPLPTAYINSPLPFAITPHAELGVNSPADLEILAELVNQSQTMIYQQLTAVNHSGTEWGYTTIGVPPQPGGSTFALRVTNTSPVAITIGLFQRTPQLEAVGA